jgi:signal transduction histidine kinase
MAGTLSTPSIPPERLEAVLQAIEALGGERDLQPLLGAVLHHACELAGGKVGSIGLVDEARRLVRIRVAQGLPDSAVGVDVPFGLGLAGEVAQSRGIVHLDRYDQLPRPMFQIVGDHAVLGLPLLSGGKVIACLSLGAPPPRSFSTEDAETLRVYVRFAAATLRTAQLFEKARQAATSADLDRLALKLHDSIQSKLSGLRIFLEMLEDSWSRGPEQGRSQTERALDVLLEIIDDVRTVSHGLHVPEASREGWDLEDTAVSGKGLAVDLRKLCMERSSRELKVTFFERHYRPQPARIEENLFCIAQEALTNVVRHSGAREATVILAHEGNWIDLKVVDDGVGFPPEVLGQEEDGTGEGLGLAGMRERAADLRAELSLHNRPGGGAILQVGLPALRGDSL